MILSYCNVSDPIVIQLFDDKKRQKDHITLPARNKKTRSHPDLLKHISECIQKNGLSPKNIYSLFFVCGPGRFTPLRIACLIANTFSQECGTSLFSVSKSDFTTCENNFQKILEKNLFQHVQSAEPVFGSLPSINNVQKNIHKSFPS